jgi:hypothetical protein
MTDQARVYLAVAPCGCPHGIDCGDGRDTAKQVARWISVGSTIERVSLEEAKQRVVWDCPHTPRWGRGKLVA